MSSDPAQYDPGACVGEVEDLDRRDYFATDESTYFRALMDIQMMNYGGGGRKERQWRAIFESVGLEIVKIWPGVKSDSVMELGLKSS
jgi:hypothetical protein